MHGTYLAFSIRCLKKQATRGSRLKIGFLLNQLSFDFNYFNAQYSHHVKSRNYSLQNHNKIIYRIIRK